MKPFRWNLSKEEQLGTLLKGETETLSDAFTNEIKLSAAKIIAFSNNAELVFVGRSAEDIYDYLSGALNGSIWEQKLHTLNISNRFEAIEEIKQKRPDAYAALQDHFKIVGIAPSDLIARRSKICFVDLVASGGTFKALYDFIMFWSKETNLDTNAIKSKVQFLGITYRTKTSPNTWRWQQKASWVKEQQVKNIKNISISGELWHYLGNWQIKVSNTNPPDTWNAESILLPPREEDKLIALRRAYNLYQQGKNGSLEFSGLLANETAMAQTWFRTLVTELRKKT